jgi:membrane protein YdbS with pleckstrin-like domain
VSSNESDGGNGTDKRSTGGPDRQPSLVPGTVLLGIAGVLIVIVLVKPDMPDWLRASIAIVAVLVVIALLVIAFRVFRGASRRGR